VPTVRLPVVTTDLRPVPIDGKIEDTFGRRVSYLRISLTDRCNYRCTYCMPEEVEFRPRTEILSFEEITRLVTVFAGLGVRRVRLTGGEPTVRRDLVEVVAMIAAVPGIQQVVMTTNGHLLAELAAPLAAAGLRGVNVSIDTLDADRFREVTRRGDLARVVAGIDAARAAGLAVKLNAVALRGINEDELVRLCEFAWERGIVTRFIEQMPMSDGKYFHPEREISAAEIRAAITAAHGPLSPSPHTSGDTGPSRYWHLEQDPRREVGIISPMTEHFCDSCNRLRLTATGALHACLGHDDALSLRDILRAGGTDDDIRAAIGASVGAKRAGHEFLLTGAGGPTKHMISMGG
jgi:cyclic pyranopterin phosphate synthase